MTGRKGVAKRKGESRRNGVLRRNEMSRKEYLSFLKGDEKKGVRRNKDEVEI